MADFRSPFVPDLPRFTGGAVGYLGYGAASWFEPVLGDLGSAQDGADDAGFMLFDTVLAFDHVQHRILIIANARITADDDLESLYQFACAKIQFLERELERNLSLREANARSATSTSSRTTRESGSSSRSATAKEHIAAGDIYQVVLSQRFEARGRRRSVHGLPRAAAREPVAVHVFHPDGRRVGRRLVARDAGARRGHRVSRRIRSPGTRRRGRNDEEDMRLAEELKRNEKERAEHVMLVDLGRNDVGRVCEYGSVRVPQFMGLERFSHVMHLTSIVEGRLADDRDRLDALVSCFPAGTVSGAPKVRAMQIIRDLEPSGRGLYAGAVGYLDFAGNLDFCIAIRTVIMSGGKAYVQAGAGIVMDSNPAAEYEETRDKARALLRALELAQQGL